MEVANNVAELRGLLLRWKQSDNGSEIRVASGEEKNHDFPVNLHCSSYFHVQRIVWEWVISQKVVSLTVAHGRIEREINPLNANSMEVGYSSFEW